MQELTFNELPAAISLLIREVQSIKLSLTANPPEPTDQLLTVDQAAEFLTLAKPTIYAMLSRGELPNEYYGQSAPPNTLQIAPPITLQTAPL